MNNDDFPLRVITVTGKALRAGEQKEVGETEKVTNTKMTLHPICAAAANTEVFIMKAAKKSGRAGGPPHTGAELLPKRALENRSRNLLTRRPTLHNFTVERDETEKFLQALDPKATEFTFQTFDEKGKNKKLVRVLNGTLDQHYDELVALNKQGAGIYVTINETDLKGRKAENVVRIRAVFVDLDGAPLEPAKQPQPHIIVESSPNRWHVYYLVTGMAVDAHVYRAAQRKLINRLGSDPKITDLPRVLRLPGFLHQKDKPFRVRVVEVRNGKPYSAEKFISHNAERQPAKSSIQEHRSSGRQGNPGGARRAACR